VAPRGTKCTSRYSARAAMLLFRFCRREARLRRGEARDRDAERRAADVVEAHGLEEADARGIAAVLAADADLELRFGRPSALDRRLDQLTPALLVEGDEGVAPEDAALDVGGEELSGVVAREAHRRLGEIVGAEGKKTRLLRELARHERRARQLDHRA